ncbi:hypothetical protein SCP_1603190 [Sparassis crispa]|uniref:JmjC domain-containing protein n=1 Tax=Sparassis crispa TaxID=139825 RepID=A0A401H5E3_9APHY|nr:hypothetical protein SCP_1603190 [Sparassis crispa]GBE89655.1 hypothetical protein SCP_1603190 [Sparassis crispa]
MEEVLKQYPKPVGLEKIQFDHVPIFSVVGLQLSMFQEPWSHGVPVVVTHIDSVFQGNWGPAYFIESYGSRPVVVQDCETETTRNTTVKDFFMNFGISDRRSSILKLKDWPPQKAFSTEFPELFKAFIDAVPCPDLARLDGVLNLAAHFPLNGLAPDLGPKMYNAFASPQDNEHHGSTKLHMDVTDAVNIMLWAASNHDGKAGSALWHIFPASSVAVLRNFLREHGFTALGDPIHSQSMYLTPGLLDLLATYGVRPYVIHQHPGQAVFIPAGCPHQVSNEVDAIKIACDFLSINNVRETQEVVSQLRYQRLQSGFGDDVLQFFTTLWYTWKSLSHMSELVAVPDIFIVGGDTHSEPPATSEDILAEEQENALSFDTLAITSPGTRQIHEICSPTASHLTQGRDTLSHLEEKKKRRKEKKHAKAHSQRPQKPGFDFTCPIPHCAGYYHRAGLLDHL